MTHYTLSFTLLTGDRAVTTDVPIEASDDHAAIRQGARLAKNAATTARVALGEVHVGQKGAPFFNWAKDYSFHLDQAVEFYVRAMPA